MPTYTGWATACDTVTTPTGTSGTISPNGQFPGTFLFFFDLAPPTLATGILPNNPIAVQPDGAFMFSGPSAAYNLVFCLGGLPDAVIVAESTYETYVLGLGAVGVWPFDDVAAPFIDHTGNASQNGVVDPTNSWQGAVTVPVTVVSAGQPSLRAGTATSVLTDGVERSILSLAQSVGAPNIRTDCVLTSVSAFTVELWVKFQTLSAGAAPARWIWYDGASILRVNTTTGLADALIINDASTYVVATGGAITVGQAYYLAVTYDDANVILYRNGEEVARQALTGPVTIYGMHWGGAEVTDVSMNVWFQNAAIYATALTADQIAATYAFGTGA